jgi:uncharacterized protein YxeA
MDRFMIDKYIKEKYESRVLPKIQLSETKTPVESQEKQEQEQQHIYYEPELIDNELVLEPVEEAPSYRFITIIGLILFIGYAIYYAVKTMYNEQNYLIKKNANTLDVTLEELKTDIKNYLKETYEKFLDWKENLKTKTNKYFFKKHLDNGAFKATKYKATNLLSKRVTK